MYFVTQDVPVNAHSAPMIVPVPPPSAQQQSVRLDTLTSLMVPVKVSYHSFYKCCYHKYTYILLTVTVSLWYVWIKCYRVHILHCATNYRYDVIWHNSNNCFILLACPKNCIDCEYDTALGSVVCKSGQCKAGYGSKTDKLCYGKIILYLYAR